MRKYEYKLNVDKPIKLIQCIRKQKKKQPQFNCLASSGVRFTRSGLQRIYLSQWELN